MTVKKFLRRDTKRFSKFGKRRKKLLGWRKPKGRDNKMREKRRGYSTVVKIGYKKEIQEKILMIKNIQDLNNLQGTEKLVLGNVGKKKKIEIAKKAKEMKIKISNLNINSFLKEIEKTKEKKENKK